MVRLGDMAEIVSGYNVARLPATNQVKKYTNADFEHDFYRMKLAAPTMTLSIVSLCLAAIRRPQLFPTRTRINLLARFFPL